MPQPLISRLTIARWRQFGEIDLEFHPNLTVLTGANASGKTTLLELLARHFKWNRRFVGIPIRNADGTFAYWIRPDAEYAAAWTEVGSISYGSGGSCTVSVASSTDTAESNKDLHFAGQEFLHGLYVTSHRSTSSYTPINDIPTTFTSADKIFQDFTAEVQNRLWGKRTSYSPFQRLKQSLIAAAAFGEGSNSVEPDPVAAELWHGFQQVLSHLFPRSLGFQRLVIRRPEVVVVTDTGEFILDEASGGLNSIMELGWQIFLKGHESNKFVVLLDEPENHLHPSLQRSLVPNLVETFPGVQFIIATHSPFVVTAHPDSAVYVLDYNRERRVESTQLDLDTKAASADETLKRVLGVDSTMPIWAEERFADIVSRYTQRDLTSDVLSDLRQELQDEGLGGEFPEAMLKLAERALADEDGP